MLPLALPTPDADLMPRKTFVESVCLRNRNLETTDERGRTVPAMLMDDAISEERHMSFRGQSKAEETI